MYPSFFGPTDSPFYGDRTGYCAGCGCLCNLNDHRCPDIVRIDGDERLAQLAGEVEQINADAERLAAEQAPTPRQLARSWIDTLLDLGVYA